MKHLLVCFFFLAVVQSVQGQYYKTDTATHKGLDRSRLIFGGAVGMVFGDYTHVDLSPLAGYRFSDYIAAGINVNAQYANLKSRDGYGDVYQRNRYTIFGGGIWGRVYPVRMLFVHIQPEYNFVSANITQYMQNNIKQTYSSNYGAPSLLLGAGYTQSIGGSVGVGISVLYDVLQDNNSPYRNGLIYRVGAGIGF